MLTEVESATQLRCEWCISAFNGCIRYNVTFTLETFLIINCHCRCVRFSAGMAFTEMRERRLVRTSSHTFKCSLIRGLRNSSLSHKITASSSLLHRFSRGTTQMCSKQLIHLISTAGQLCGRDLLYRVPNYKDLHYNYSGTSVPV